MLDSPSEFTIKPKSGDAEGLPLVLPVEAGNKYASLKYVNGTWGKENKASYKDGKDISERQLPFDGTQHAYLTISDFLEDIIIRVPHVLNCKNYFGGNVRGDEDNKSYLLPVKPLYFKYFNVEMLKSTMPDGKAAIEMDVVDGGSVCLTLRIPIVGNSQIRYIEYQRLYYNDRQPSVNANNNEGGIIELNFSGFVMPGVKFQQDSDAYYTVSCVSSFSTQAKVYFYQDGNVLRDIPMDCRNQRQGEYAYKAETYTLEKKNFDCLRIVCANGQGGLLIPSFPSQQSLEVYEFAVDLGTSNTHIEMKKAGENGSVPFSCDESDGIMSSFFIPSYKDSDGERIQLDLRNENDLINADFIPSAIGEESDFYFPTRTVLSCAKCINWNDALRVFGLLNFSMTYNRKRRLAYNAEPVVNIKWSNDANSQAAMQLYIENLLLIIRNKVAVMNGNLQQTKITWFYPNSMSQRRLAQVRTAWNRAYTKLFSPSGNVVDESESEAPIQYYFRRYATATNLVNIDIGGGTTDVAFSDGGDVKYITSFRFAANSLFEDSFSDINPNNGIIDWFKTDMLDLLKTVKNNSDLMNIFNDNDGHPANMASFLFSLKDNSATKGIANNKIDFNTVLQNDDKFKIVFILFYTAIIYHVAQIVRVKGLDVPRHIAFSGNGSKIVNVLTTDTKILANYTKIIFEKILGKPYGNTLDILGLDNASNPKEATCKGGLLPIKQQTIPEKVMLKNSAGEMVGNNDTYLSLDDNTRKQIVKSVKGFFYFVLEEVPSVFNFDKNFGVLPETIAIAKEECMKDLATYLDKGIKLSVLESGNMENNVEDALPFYPIKGAIQALSTRIEEYLRAR